MLSCRSLPLTWSFFFLQQLRDFEKAEEKAERRAEKKSEKTQADNNDKKQQAEVKSKKGGAKAKNNAASKNASKKGPGGKKNPTDWVLDETVSLLSILEFERIREIRYSDDRNGAWWRAERSIHQKRNYNSAWSDEIINTRK